MGVYGAHGGSGVFKEGFCGLLSILAQPKVSDNSLAITLISLLSRLHASSRMGCLLLIYWGSHDDDHRGDAGIF